jgi:hypothetical protein
MMTYIKIDDCKNGYLYSLHSRNLTYGVYNEENKGFIGIREKFEQEYLFTEYHWDTGPPYGTVKPIKELEKFNGPIFESKKVILSGDPKPGDSCVVCSSDLEEAGKVVWRENEELRKFLNEAEKSGGK